LDIPLGQFNTLLEGKEVKGIGGFSFDPITSWMIGATADFPIHKWFHIQAEIDYSVNYGKGAMYASLESNPYIPTFPTEVYRPENLRLSYLQIPVLAKFYPIKNTALLIGPYFGYGMGFKGKATAIEGAKEKNISYMYKKIDFGGTFGATYEFKFGLFAEIRYVMGLMKTLQKNFILKDVEITSSETTVNVNIKANTEHISGQNNSFQMNIGYRF
ncbi:MAG: porin family protein, partial [Flavobacteriales bacterium]|nr:porin family protein [Flavobacteriales bacterium]